MKTPLKRLLQLLLVLLGYASLAVTLFVTNFEFHISAGAGHKANEVIVTPIDDLAPNRIVCAAWDTVMRNDERTKTPRVTAIAGRRLTTYDAFVNAKGMFSYIFSFGLWIVLATVALVVMLVILIGQGIAAGDIAAIGKALLMLVLSVILCVLLFLVFLLTPIGIFFILLFQNGTTGYYVGMIVFPSRCSPRGSHSFSSSEYSRRQWKPIGSGSPVKR